jgi:hypothetical protein
MYSNTISYMNNKVIDENARSGSGSVSQIIRCTGMDPRIWIRTKMSRIGNTANRTLFPLQIKILLKTAVREK